MERFIDSDIVVIDFPFTNLSRSKRRPALVIKDLLDNDLLLCQITSKIKRDNKTIILEEKDIIEGNLKKISAIRPNRLFTFNRDLIIRRIGRVSQKKYEEVINAIIKILKEKNN